MRALLRRQQGSRILVHASPVSEQSRRSKVYVRCHLKFGWDRQLEFRLNVRSTEYSMVKSADTRRTKDYEGVDSFRNTRPPLFCYESIFHLCKMESYDRLKR